MGQFVRKCTLLDVRLGELVVCNLLQHMWALERRAALKASATSPRTHAGAIGVCVYVCVCVCVRL